MAKPRFSLIIPTRNRPKTLRWSLRTCVAQDRDDTEIIVCDNCGDSQTRDVVEEVGKGKVRYVRSDVPLAMSDNWELALSQATGDYNMIVGDDDGLLLHALTQADEMLRELSVDVLTGTSVHYIWPGYDTKFVDDNVLRMPTFRRTSVRKSSDKLREVTRDLHIVRSLPSLYNSFVHRTVVDRIRGKNGRVFNSPIPDWFSAFAIGSSVDSFGDAGVPFHIIGAGPTSIGRDFIMGQATATHEEFVRLNSASGLKWSGETPQVHISSSAIAAECVHQVLVHLRPSDARLRVNPKELSRAIVIEMQRHPAPIPRETWQSYTSELRAFTEKHGIALWFSNEFPGISSSTPPPPPDVKKPPTGAFTNELTLDASQFGVTNVFEAALLCERLLLRHELGRGVDWRKISTTTGITSWIDETAKLVRTAAPIPMVQAVRELKRRVRNVKRYTQA